MLRPAASSSFTLNGVAVFNRHLRELLGKVPQLGAAAASLLQLAR